MSWKICFDISYPDYLLFLSPQAVPDSSLFLDWFPTTNDLVTKILFSGIFSERNSKMLPLLPYFLYPVHSCVSQSVKSKGPEKKEKKLWNEIDKNGTKINDHRTTFVCSCSSGAGFCSLSTRRTNGITIQCVSLDSPSSVACPTVTCIQR